MMGPGGPSIARRTAFAQLGSGKRLAQEVGALAEAAHAVQDFAGMSGDEQDAQAGTLPAHGVGDLAAVHARHDDVGGRAGRIFPPWVRRRSSAASPPSASITW
jgi:hypothetical protein